MIQETRLVFFLRKRIYKRIKIQDVIVTMDVSRQEVLRDDEGEDEGSVSPSSSAFSLTPEPLPPFSGGGGLKRNTSELQSLLLASSPPSAVAFPTTAEFSRDTNTNNNNPLLYVEQQPNDEGKEEEDDDEAHADAQEVLEHLNQSASARETDHNHLVDGNHAVMLEESSSNDEDDMPELRKSLLHHRRPSTIEEVVLPADSAPTSSQPACASSWEPQYTIPRFLFHTFLNYSSTASDEQHSSAPSLPPMINATAIGFWALLHVTCATYVLTPLRDAVALTIGVAYMPQLTLASTVLALFSSVPIGWLFEAPDPNRRRLWKRMGLTRGATQGTSLALFYRCFAFVLLSYALGFQGLEWVLSRWTMLQGLGRGLYIAFYLIVHLMKLHCLSLLWGVTTETMEYEDVARKQQQRKLHGSSLPPFTSVEGGNKLRLKRLATVGFGGTLGGILGSFLASSMAQVLRLPGLLVLAACLLEIAAELSIELGRIMQKHWEEQQQLFQSTTSLISLDPSMRRSTSLGSMKRISSGNSLNRIKSTTDLDKSRHASSGSLQSLGGSSSAHSKPSAESPATPTEDTFSQRMLRGVTTILRSRLLMAIFTYNALYASTNVLLSFQRATLVANRGSTTVQADTAFLANINMASSAAIFALQASGIGASMANLCGPRGTLVLMPLVRFLGVLALAWWHRVSGGEPPHLLAFLVLDECCKVMNLAVAKPVRESLWRGLSNEARYEAKPIVDTLANRWGGGSAAFLVSFVDKTMYWLGASVDPQAGTRNMFGLTPVLFLCLSISAWWTVVSADLGNIRGKIDVELAKKRQ